MKRKLKLSICFLLMCVFAFQVIGCAKVAVNFTVTVTGGNGSGEYAENTDCTATATVPQGQKFVKWVDKNGAEVSVANPYTFKVTNNAELSAVFENNKTFTVVVKGGAITGTTDKTATIAEGQQVSVTAPNTQAKMFKNWLINGTDTSTANPYVFTAAKDMEIVAIVDETFLIAASGGTINGELRQKFKMGDECTLVADEAPLGQEFAYWYIIDETEQVKVVSKNATYTFAVTESEKYYAKFDRLFTVTVEGGYISSEEGNPSSVIVIDGDMCTVLPTIPDGKGFVEWQINGVKVSANMQYRFDVSKNITVKAIFGDLLYTFEKPENSANQMFKHNDDYSIIELDRMKMADGTTSKTAFVENADYVLFYVYTAANASKDAFVAKFILDVKTGVRLATISGETTLVLEGSAGNIWKQTGLNRDVFFTALKQMIGEGFSDKQEYFFAAQVCALAGSLYAPSEISEIGPQGFGPYRP